MSTADWIQSCVLLVTIIALGWQILQSNRLSRLENFRGYTQRYQSIVLHLPSTIRSEDFNLDALPEDEQETTLRYMRAYFDLCSEEHYLWRNDCLDAKVWALWEQGMKESFRRPAFRAAWKRIQAGYSGTEFADFVAQASSSRVHQSAS